MPSVRDLLPTVALAALLALGPGGVRLPFANAQDGSLSGATTSPGAANYNCDPAACKLPSCQCASTSPPGGLALKDVPQFITFTADDAVQSYTINAVQSFLAQRKNPNGCPPLMTYFTSLNYTNYTLVTDWYVAGNEIADHTMTHVGTPPQNEVEGNLIALNALAGIPFKEIIGFRAPYLNYSADTLKMLANDKFTYDSSASSSLPINQTGTDAFWPYTLDYGMANDCLTVPGICSGQPKLPGFWEIPMYAIFSPNNGLHLMDPWLDSNNPNEVLGWLKDNFMAHYNGNKVPFGLYTHPIHVARGYPGVPDPNATISMINQFLDWATASEQFQNVWFVSNAQLLAWMQNPVPASQLNTLPAFQCQTANVQEKICNGMPANEAGLLAHCPFPDFPFYTCYGCPSDPPTPANPNPPQATQSGGALRHRIPENCATAFWDPIGNKCLCTGGACAFTDATRPIGPNGANLTSNGGTGGNDPASSSTPSYTPFNGARAAVGPGAAVVLASVVGVALASWA